ncbi:MAG: type II toxin-antitoxin system VapC family toxin [Alphaproteobacteria bacterium]|nr:type II toxin-antitoxin system VapC family toxin [Alphaproteobacteria bacterium]
MIVVDASVAVKWVVQEPDSAAAEALRFAGELIAPENWLVEAANALWKYVVRRQLSAPQAEQRLLELRAAPVIASAIDPDIHSALQLAIDLNHPIYDCLYLALAIRLGTHVVTADRRFAALSGRRADLDGRVRSLTL